jgi:hypothetical protein
VEHPRSRGELATNAVPDPSRVICTRIVAKLHAQIDALGVDDSRAIPAAERANRIAKLEADLLAAEMLEEQYVSAAQAAGFDALRRPRADARAVLGIRITTRAARAA